MAKSSGRRVRVPTGETLRKQRTIGIRYALKELQKVGLLEENVKYADKAIPALQSLVMAFFQQGYKAGARRGAKQILEAIRAGDLEVRKTKTGNTIIRPHIDAIEWERSLSMAVGKEKRRIPKQLYRLTIKRLGLE